MVSPELEMEVGVGGDIRWKGLHKAKAGGGNGESHGRNGTCDPWIWDGIWQERKVGPQGGNSHS